jgi:hypothetical protein
MSIAEPKKVLAGQARKHADSMHVLLHKQRTLPPAAKLARDGGPYTLRGTTANFNVYYEDGLADTGAALADGVLASCESEYTALQSYFGGITPGGLPFNIFVVAGDFGAYHANCAATEFHCAVFDGSNTDLVRMLVVAEEVEVFEAAQAAGWDCGASHGEGLSRILGAELYPDALNGFASASTWLNSDRPDWINNTEPTDRNYVSIGCAVLFLNYLRYQLNFSWNDIIAAAAPTLAQTYTNLTGKTDGYDQFSALIEANFPAGGGPYNLPNDNPFPLPSPSRIVSTKAKPGGSKNGRAGRSSDQETRKVDTHQVRPFMKAQNGRAPSELLGTGFTTRVDWGDKHGQWKLTLNWDAVTQNSRVLVSATEWDENGNGFLGSARYTIHNVSPFDGGVGVWVEIEWDSDIRVRLDYLVINP